MKISKNNQKYPLLREPTNYQDIYNLKDKEEWFKAVNDCKDMINIFSTLINLFCTLNYLM